MRQLSIAIAAAMLFAATITAFQPAAAQTQCRKGEYWDYGSQSCKKLP